MFLFLLLLITHRCSFHCAMFQGTTLVPIDISRVKQELSASISQGENQAVRNLKVQSDDMSVFV